MDLAALATSSSPATCCSPSAWRFWRSGWLGFILFTERAEEAQRLAPQTSPTLLRLTGLAAVVGGVLVVLLDLVQFAKLGFPDVGLIPYETSNVTITIIWVQQNLTYFGLA